MKVYLLLVVIALIAHASLHPWHFDFAERPANRNKRQLGPKLAGRCGIVVRLLCKSGMSCLSAGALVLASLAVVAGVRQYSAASPTFLDLALALLMTLALWLRLRSALVKDTRG